MSLTNNVVNHMASALYNEISSLEDIILFNCILMAQIVTFGPNNHILNLFN